MPLRLHKYLARTQSKGSPSILLMIRMQDVIGCVTNARATITLVRRHMLSMCYKGYESAQVYKTR